MACKRELKIANRSRMRRFVRAPARMRSLNTRASPIGHTMRGSRDVAAVARDAPLEHERMCCAIKAIRNHFPLLSPNNLFVIALVLFLFFSPFFFSSLSLLQIHIIRHLSQLLLPLLSLHSLLLIASPSIRFGAAKHKNKQTPLSRSCHLSLQPHLLLSLSPPTPHLPTPSLFNQSFHHLALTNPFLPFILSQPLSHFFHPCRLRTHRSRRHSQLPPSTINPKCLTIWLFSFRSLLPAHPHLLPQTHLLRSHPPL